MASDMGRGLRHFTGVRKRWHPIGSAAVAALALATALGATGLHAQGFDGSPWPAAKPVPELQARDLQGQPWRLSDLRGRAVVINFWASWCAPCQAEMPSLQALAHTHGPDKLVVLAVNFKESAPVALRFVQRTGLELPVLLDPQGAIARQWQVKVFPSTVLIAADGKVKVVVRGELDWTGPQAAALVEPLLRPADKKTR
jgi:thiol-disulfide isomerase/thioredoxin